MKRALTIALMSLALSVTYANSCYATCMDDLRQMQAQIDQHGNITTINNKIVNFLGKHVASDGLFCSCLGGNRRDDDSLRFTLGWQKCHWRDTLKAFKSSRVEWLQTSP